MTARTNGHRLRTLGDLTNIHMGRAVTVNGLTGTLVGLLPCGDRIALELRVGGTRALTAALPAETCVEVWQKEAS